MHVARALLTVSLCTVAPAQLTVLEPGFAVRTYAPSGGAKFLECSPGGVWGDFVYVADSAGDRVERIHPDGSMSLLANLAPGAFPVGLAFGPGPGNDFGQFVYCSDFGTGDIVKIDPAGTVTPFVSLTAPGSVTFDPTGAYGNELFATVAFSGPIVKIDSSGTTTPFSPLDSTYLRFGPGGAWGTGLYSTNGGALPGLSRVDSSGAAAQFANGFVVPEGFDWAFGPGFGGDLFATDVVTGEIWRVKPDGSRTLFATLPAAAAVTFCDCGLYVVSALGGCYKIYFPWEDVGLGLAGVSGVPVLTGSGTTLAGDPVGITLTNARPDAPAALFLGSSRIDFAFFGGTFVPLPENAFAGGTDANGSFTVNGRWPAGQTRCAASYFQAWILDSAAVAGLSASNGLCVRAQ